MVVGAESVLNSPSFALNGVGGGPRPVVLPLSTKLHVSQFVGRGLSVFAKGTILGIDEMNSPLFGKGRLEK
ncbi:hypothetical protein Pla52o_20940 [Novipirellula galeiformis]|uniref:Uncharacterized protein n=1 Tax=Novipirellula galeiformis TaxID=2528004 RepID=A0A5C6CHP0_9BACT|nr:hypothetical protein Pla52o_20940 [Novipirellula galeiformis]